MSLQILLRRVPRMCSSMGTLSMFLSLSLSLPLPLSPLSLSLSLTHFLTLCASDLVLSPRAFQLSIQAGAGSDHADVTGSTYLPHLRRIKATANLSHLSFLDALYDRYFQSYGPCSVVHRIWFKANLAGEPMQIQGFGHRSAPFSSG